MNKRKEKLSIVEKCNILQALNDATKPKDICKQHNLNKCTISRIKNNKHRIINFAKKSMQLPIKIKRISNVNVPLIEDALYQWFINERLKNNIVNNEMLKIKAIQFHQNLNFDISFTASYGWIQKFKKRYLI